MKIFKHPGADPTWCPEKRANWVNGANHETTVHGKLRVCLLWCWDLYSGHLVPHYSGDAQLRDRRSNGYGGQCWGRGTPRCKSGLCSVCERGEGSCCRSNFRDWSPECSGHGSRGKHRCSDTNGECLKVCGLKNSDGTYRPYIIPGRTYGIMYGLYRTLYRILYRTVLYRNYIIPYIIPYIIVVSRKQRDVGGESGYRQSR